MLIVVVLEVLTVEKAASRPFLKEFQLVGSMEGLWLRVLVHSRASPLRALNT